MLRVSLKNHKDKHICFKTSPWGGEGEGQWVVVVSVYVLLCVLDLTSLKKIDEKAFMFYLVHFSSVLEKVLFNVIWPF